MPLPSASSGGSTLDGRLAPMFIKGLDDARNAFADEDWRSAAPAVLAIEVFAEGVEALAEELGELVNPAGDVCERLRA